MSVESKYQFVVDLYADKHTVQSTIRDLSEHLVMHTDCFVNSGDGFWRLKGFPNTEAYDKGPSVLLKDFTGNFFTEGRLVGVDFERSKALVKIDQGGVYRSPMVSFFDFDRLVRWDKKEVPNSKGLLHTVCNKIIDSFIGGRGVGLSELKQALDVQHDLVFG